MTEIIIVSIALVAWFIGMLVEHRNPLWSEIVSSGESLPEIAGRTKSVQMVFFWKSSLTYKESEYSDYWNSMDVICLPSGLIIKRPIFLFGRKSVYFPWSNIEPGSTFRAWFLKRRSLHIRGTKLYLSVTENLYKHQMITYLQVQC